MSGAKAAKKKQSLWETLRAASGPYRRLLGYVKPYKVRFIVGLLLGFAYGGVSSLLPLAISRVTGTIFQGAARDPTALRSNLHALDTENQFDCSYLSGHSSDHDAAQPLLVRKYLLHAVGKQQSGDGYSGPAFQQNGAPFDGFL
jgi:ABC-type multidrug transport system fused ATPase/permease subunit